MHPRAVDRLTTRELMRLCDYLEARREAIRRRQEADR